MNRPSRRYALDCASPLALSQPGARAKKRQRTAAVQDAIATATASSRFKVPMHAQKRKQAVPRHPDSRDPSSVALQRRVDGLSCYQRTGADILLLTSSSFAEQNHI